MVREAGAGGRIAKARVEQLVAAEEMAAVKTAPWRGIVVDLKRGICEKHGGNSMEYHVVISC